VETRSAPHRGTLRAEYQHRLWPGARGDQGWYWLLILETDEFGDGTRVVVEQVDGTGETRWPWIAAEGLSEEIRRADVVSIAKEGQIFHRR